MCGPTEHSRVTGGLTSGGVGLSFGVVGSRFTAIAGVDVALDAGVPGVAVAVFPVAGFA